MSAEANDPIRLDKDVLDEISGLANLALSAVDYSPIEAAKWKSDGICKVVSGSTRDKITFDIQSGQMVGASDFVGLLRVQNEDVSVRRLMFAWEDGAEAEVDLDDGLVLTDETHFRAENKTERLAKVRARIFGVLGALSEDAI